MKKKSYEIKFKNCVLRWYYSVDLVISLDLHAKLNSTATVMALGVVVEI